MEWNEKRFGKNFYTFSILAHVKVIFILNAVNKAAFNQMCKIIKEKSSQKCNQMARVEKKNGSYNQISDTVVTTYWIRPLIGAKSRGTELFESCGELK